MDKHSTEFMSSKKETMLHCLGISERNATYRIVQFFFKLVPRAFPAFKMEGRASRVGAGVGCGSRARRVGRGGRARGCQNTPKIPEYCVAQNKIKSPSSRLNKHGCHSLGITSENTVLSCVI